MKLTCKVTFLSRTQASPSLYLAGKLFGGQELTVGEGARVVVAQTGVIGTAAAIPGIFVFLKLQVSGGGVIEFERGTTYKSPIEIRSVSINIAYGGTLQGPYFRFRSSYLNVAFNGTINADALGYKASQGPGAGSNITLTGGSYGGCGGETSLQYCKVYGTMARATSFGSGGGSSVVNSKFGAGGGIVEVHVEKLIINGMISSSGGAADNSTTGGGSGGSVHLSVSQQVCYIICSRL